MFADKSCSSYRCGQKCFKTPQGPKCYCKEGFSMKSDEETCTGIVR